MNFDPLDNLFGAGLGVWIWVGLIWAGGIVLFCGLPDGLTRKGRARNRRQAQERRERAEARSAAVRDLPPPEGPRRT